MSKMTHSKADAPLYLAARAAAQVLANSPSQAYAIGTKRISSSTASLHRQMARRCALEILRALPFREAVDRKNFAALPESDQLVRFLHW